MRWSLSSRDLERLAPLHPDLVKVVRAAALASPEPFVVLEGIRSAARQAQLVIAGASQTLNSRHLTGHAVDIAPLLKGKVSWHWPHYRKLAPYVKAAAREYGVALDWGGDWETFPDGPHWQLNWLHYPRNK